jgi:rhomboid protease GluP
MEVTASPTPLLRSQWMTFFLISLNVAVFLILQNSGGPTYENLILFGAKENGLVAEGQLGRLFFPMFLHANLLHLAFNMWGLYQVGRALELMVGAKRLLLLYLAAGVTGNVASFALVDPMSVGASGALFGFLSCLWVVQKYEQKLMEEMNEPIQKSTLGMLLIFNFALSFLVPNIDWACHLGGCIAGVFVGLGMVMRHRVSLRRLRMARFLSPSDTPPKNPVWENELLYSALLLIFNLVLCLGYFKVTNAVRAFGLGVYAAAQNQTENKSLELLPSFRVLLVSANSESNPEKLLTTAIRLHEQDNFSSAVAVYDVLLDLHAANMGSSEFVSQTTGAALKLARGAALQAQTLNEDLKTSFAPVSSLSKMEPAKVCGEAANLFRTLGFFGLAGRLFECSFYLNTKNIESASSVVECYWKYEEDPKKQVTRFRYVLEQIYDRSKISKDLQVEPQSL